MSDTLRVMLKLWKIKNMDWLGYENEERYSYHHIKKKSDGGKTTLENGAILHQSSHEYLHKIEYYDIEKYLILNTILKEINKQREQPSIEQLRLIKEVLLEFQNEYDGKLSSRNKLIIKQEYKL